MTQRLITERPALDLSRFAFKREKHGITVFGTWFFEGRRSEPCLVLLPANKKISRLTSTPVVVPLSTAWIFAEHDDVGDPVEASRTIREWLAAGLLPGSAAQVSDRVRVLDVINDNLRDLIMMPPAPFKAIKDQIVGEAQVVDKNTGRVLFHSEVRH
ncbi:hypothetical protein [Celeribacter sp.]|uniref:hypothetical protein n=1 Tax=Celeribacter sp. TaxID=1890673 RepID=UPI003A925E95